MDMLKTVCLSAAIGIPIFSAVLHLIAWGGPHFWLYVWAFIFVISLTLITIYPIFIAPLFNTFAPLQDGPLKSAIEDLAKRVPSSSPPLFLKFVPPQSSSERYSAYLLLFSVLFVNTTFPFPLFPFFLFPFTFRRLDFHSPGCMLWMGPSAPHTAMRIFLSA